MQIVFGVQLFDCLYVWFGFVSLSAPPMRFIYRFIGEAKISVGTIPFFFSIVLFDWRTIFLTSPNLGAHVAIRHVIDPRYVNPQIPLCWYSHCMLIDVAICYWFSHSSAKHWDRLAEWGKIFLMVRNYWLIAWRRVQATYIDHAITGR